jgi:hypothetical protein
MPDDARTLAVTALRKYDCDFEELSRPVPNKEWTKDKIVLPARARKTPFKIDEVSKRLREKYKETLAYLAQ